MQGGTGIDISGSGSANNPYIITVESGGGDIGGLLTVQDSATQDLILTGDGTTASPYQLTVNSTIALDELDDVSAGEPVPNGYVLAKSGTQWLPVPPSTAPVGAVSSDTPILGDGSSGSHIRLLVDPAGLLASTGAGLKVADTQRAAGGIFNVTLSNQAIKTTAVTFPAGRFSATPAAVANFSLLTQTYLAQAHGITSTGMSVSVFTISGNPATLASSPVSWVAQATG